MAEVVVGASFLRVGEDFVGLVDLLEARVRTVFAADVGVMLARQSAEGAPDLVFAGPAFDAKDLVVIALDGHAWRILGGAGAEAPAPPVLLAGGTLGWRSLAEATRTVGTLAT